MSGRLRVAQPPVFVQLKLSVVESLVDVVRFGTPIRAHD